VKRSSKTKKPCPNPSTKSKTQISEKRRKKQRSGSDVGEIANSVRDVIVELPQEKVGELDKTHELRVKGKKKLKINEESNMTQSFSSKTRKAHEKKIPVPISKPKKKKRRLFEEEISIPVSKLDEASCPTHRTTRSMAKHVKIPHVPYFPEDPFGILTSPEKEYMHVATISETKELVMETLKDLRK
jgi:hypothetical protein